jgi:hypothetical protein
LRGELTVWFGNAHNLEVGAVQILFEEALRMSMDKAYDGGAKWHACCVRGRSSLCGRIRDGCELQGNKDQGEKVPHGLPSLPFQV